MFFEDDRSDEELEDEMKDVKDVTEKQGSLRDEGILRTGGESSLEDFEDPEIDTRGENNE